MHLSTVWDNKKDSLVEFGIGKKGTANANPSKAAYEDGNYSINIKIREIGSI